MGLERVVRMMLLSPGGAGRTLSGVQDMYEGPAEGLRAGSRSSRSRRSDTDTCPLPTHCSRSSPGGGVLLQWLACLLYLAVLRPCAATDLLQIASTMTPATDSLSSSGNHSTLEHLHAPSSSSSPSCEPLSIPDCRRSSMVPWDSTSLPNLLQHGSQEEAGAALLQDFRSLLRSNCSRFLPTFLCAVYAPPCPHRRHHQQSTGHHLHNTTAPPPHHHRPPCRELCLAVRRSCDVIRRKLRLSWPHVAANCGRLPLSTATTSGDDACVSVPLPALQSESSFKPAAQSSLNKTPGCKCKKEKKLGKKVYMNSSFNYAMKGTYLSTQGFKNGPMVITVRAEEVLKTDRVQIPNNTSLTLWVGKGCVCPRLIAGHKYIFLGYEDAVDRRLLFDRNSVAMSWKEGWRRLVDKWETRLQRKLARDRRRRKRKRVDLQEKIFDRRILTHQGLKTHGREGRREREGRMRGRHSGRRHRRPGS